MTGSAGGLDLLLGRLAETVRSDRQFGRDLTAGEDLHRVRASRQALGLQRLGGHLVAGFEALGEVGEVDRLRLGAEVLEGHRLLHVRAAELSHPHVDRVLPALVARLFLRARARARALVAATGGLAVTAALAPADALAAMGRARLRPQIVQTDLVRARV